MLCKSSYQNDQRNNRRLYHLWNVAAEITVYLIDRIHHDTYLLSGLALDRSLHRISGEFISKGFTQIALYFRSHFNHRPSAQIIKCSPRNKYGEQSKHERYDFLERLFL